MSVICVNSTLPVRRAMRRDGHVSPLHHWGYEPQPGDIPLAHRLTRVGITLRARMGGLDFRVLAQTYHHLNRGAQGVFLVSQPDLWAALPWLRRRFPQKRFVTWVWMDWEVERHLARLAVCDHVLCLSPEAKHRFDAAGLGDRSSYVVWGCDPTHYRATANLETDFDVLVSGLTSRDQPLMRQALSGGRYRALIIGGPAAALGAGIAGCTTLAGFDREQTFIDTYHRASVSWLPLVPHDPYLPGFTNLIESLLCGTAVVISDCTRIAAPHLRLPGVFLHRTGDLPDFLRATEAALAFARAPGQRAAIARAAAEVFHGRELARTARRALGLAATA